MIFNLIAVAVGGACGAVVRYLVSEGMNIWIPSENALSNFPVATFLVNVIGCFLIGIASCFFARDHFVGNEAWRFFAITGVLGGFTTFSTFALESATLMKSGHPKVAFLYMLLSILVGVGAIFITEFVCFGTSESLFENTHPQ